ncbi:MAG: hypothetical protein LBE12_16850 [Planctomycetaceae bacterium]|jgi:hypothetical protein|nr:hypothetical protein [Planctomycetaceae bacterium]
MKKYLFLFVLLVCGCSDKPADVPQLFPCKVIVTKDMVPVEGVHTVLGLINDSSQCAVFGITNSSGIATIRTSRLGWQDNGAPIGEYIVTISKEPKLEGGLSTEEYQKLDPIKQEHYQLEQQRKYDALPREIPVDLSDVTKSPYRLVVTKEGENVLNIDIKTNKNTPKPFNDFLE